MVSRARVFETKITDHVFFSWTQNTYFIYVRMLGRGNSASDITSFQTYVCVSVGKECWFFGIFCVCYSSWVTSWILRLFQPLFVDNFLLVQNSLFINHVCFVSDWGCKLVILVSFLIEGANMVENAGLSSGKTSKINNLSRTLKASVSLKLGVWVVLFTYPLLKITGQLLYKEKKKYYRWL